MSAIVRLTMLWHNGEPDNHCNGQLCLYEITEDSQLSFLSNVPNMMFVSSIFFVMMPLTAILFYLDDLFFSIFTYTHVS